MNSNGLKALLLLAVGVVATVLIITRSGETPLREALDAAPVETPEPVAREPMPTPPAAADDEPQTREEDDTLTSAATAGNWRYDTQDNCIGAQEALLAAGHRFETEKQRFIAMSATGPVFDSYRSLGQRDIESMARNGDSHAMIVEGLRKILEMLDQDPETAVDVLIEGRQFRHYVRLAEFSDKYGEKLDWIAGKYYSAALNGLPLALADYGSLQSIRHGGPVGLGWISEEAFNALETSEQAQLHPTMIYVQVANRLAPELQQGMGILLTEQLPENSVAGPIVARLVEQYAEDRYALGLPPLALPPSQLSTDDLDLFKCWLAQEAGKD